jgi:hypothetical protein
MLKLFFILRSPRTTRNNRSSPHNGPIKKFFSLKSYYLCITNKEITQIPKSESKKFVILCTFKGEFGKVFLLPACSAVTRFSKTITCYVQYNYCNAEKP